MVDVYYKGVTISQAGSGETLEIFEAMVAGMLPTSTNPTLNINLSNLGRATIGALTVNYTEEGFEIIDGEDALQFVDASAVAQYILGILGDLPPSVPHARIYHALDLAIGLVYDTFFDPDYEWRIDVVDSDGALIGGVKTTDSLDSTNTKNKAQDLLDKLLLESLPIDAQNTIEIHEYDTNTTQTRHLVSAAPLLAKLEEMSLADSIAFWDLGDSPTKNSDFQLVMGEDEYFFLPSLSATVYLSYTLNGSPITIPVGLNSIDVMNIGSSHTILFNTRTGSGANDIIFGTSSSDDIYGHTGADKLLGRGGDDVFAYDIVSRESGLDGDTIDGGDGLDTIDYTELRIGAEEDLGVKVNLATGIAQRNKDVGVGASDTLYSIENIIGSNFKDHITGNENDNEISGGAGKDEIWGGGGNDVFLGTSASNLEGDVYDGGENGGTYIYGEEYVGDRLSYAETIEQGLNFRLEADVVRISDKDTFGADADTATNIEYIQATNKADYFEFKGSNPTYSITFDAMGQGLGNGDVADFSASSEGIIILDETTGDASINKVHGSNITLKNFEVFIGSAYADIIEGNSSDNIFVGGKSNDEIFGGNGSDAVSFADSDIALEVSFKTVSGNTIVDLTGLSAEAKAYYGEDTLDSIESAVGSQGSDRFNILDLNFDDNQAPWIDGAGNDVAGDVVSFETIAEGLTFEFDGGARNSGGTSVKIDGKHIEFFNIEKVHATNNTDIFKIITLDDTQEILLDGKGNNSEAPDVIDFSSYDHQGTGIGIDNGSLVTTGLEFRNVEKIIGTADADRFGSIAIGTTIDGGGGADWFQVNDNIRITGVSGDDTVYFLGNKLTGGWRSIVSESEMTSSQGIIRYGRNTEGDLVIEVVGLQSQISGRNWTTYIADYQNTLDGAPDNDGGIFIYNNFIGSNKLLKQLAPDAQRLTTFKIFEAQMTAMGYFQGPVDPLVFDLDGDGIEVVAESRMSPLFDMNGDGFAERSGWTTSSDGFLVMDINDNGNIDDISEMFGNATQDGYAALAAIDSNSDNVIDSLDTAWADLRLWVDTNNNGVTDGGELRTLASYDIVSINVSPTVTIPDLEDGYGIMATGSYTKTDMSTGATGSVTFANNMYVTRWLEDVTITSEAEALPEVKGHGTIPNLRAAMSHDPALLDVVENTLPYMITHDLVDLREAAMPILNAWAASVDVPAGTPGTESRIDVPLLVTSSIDGTEVVDFAIQVIDELGTYWVLASNNDVLDSEEDVIERPTYEQVMQQLTEVGEGWTVLSADMISFMERWTGLNMPFGIDTNTGSASLNAAKDVISFLWEELNKLVVEIAAQHTDALGDFFEGIIYNSETEWFEPSSERQLAPMLEAIFSAAPLTEIDAENYIASWRPLLDVVLSNFDRGGSLVVSYGYLFQNIVAAYENVGLPTDIVTAAELLAIPEDIIINSGSSLITGTSEADIIYMASGNQIMKAGTGHDNYIYGRSVGIDTIEDVDATLGDDHHDMVRFSQHQASEIKASRDGNDLILTVIATGEKVTIVDQFVGRPEALFGGYVDLARGISEIVFADGTVWDRVDIAFAISDPQSSHDILEGTDRVDVLDGGAGNDQLRGGNGSDIYIFAEGYGQDVIHDDYNNSHYVLSTDLDIITFKDHLLSDIQFYREGNSDDLQILIPGSDDKLTILDQFNSAYTGITGTQWFDRIEGFAFKDGELLRWDEIISAYPATLKTAGNDIIYGFAWEDTLDGGGGNDYLSGGEEDDTYLFGFGYDDDIIEEGFTQLASGDNDTVIFGEGVAVEDVTISRDEDSDDLLITLSDGSTLTILDQFQTSITGVFGAITWDQIENFVFQDTEETVWSNEDIVEMLLAQSQTSGNDVVYGFTREDTFDAGAGNDQIFGGAEGDTYHFGRGDGHDVIFDQSQGLAEGDNIDRIVFDSDINPEDIRIESGPGDDDFVLKIIDTGETITILDQNLIYTLGPAFRSIEEVVFADSTVWTPQFMRSHYLANAGTSGNDTIIGFATANVMNGGAGDDILKGGGRGDTYIWGASYGNDTIDDYIERVTFTGDDKIQFMDLAYADVTFSLSGDDIIVEIIATNETLTVKNQFGSAYDYRWIENWVFTDLTKTHYELDLLLNGTTPVINGTTASETINGDNGPNAIFGFSGNDVLNGGLGDDNLVGAEGNDILNGGDNNDRLSGGLGNDILRGNDGDDIYIYEVGHDTIDEQNLGTDEIQLPDNITIADLIFVRGTGASKDNLYVTVGTLGTLSIIGQFNGYMSEGRIEQIRFADNSTLDLTSFSSSAVHGTASADILTGISLGESIFGYEGNDDISASSGNDIVYGGAGDDLINGGGGNDILHGDEGSDSLYGDDGNDTLYGGEGDDYLNGEEGDDILYGNDGNDTLRGSDGSDAIYGGAGEDDIQGGNDADTIYGDDGDDLINGGSGNDIIYGGMGKDSIDSSAGNDVVYGGEGDDSIKEIDFTSGNDTFYGEGGNDILYGGNDVDTLDGGSGDDTLYGGDDADTLKGGSGNDNYLYYFGNDADLIIEESGDADRISVGTETLPEELDFAVSSTVDMVIEFAGNSLSTITIEDQLDPLLTKQVEYIYFSEKVFLDLTTYGGWISGTSSGETLSGTAGKDVIFGLSGADIINAGADDDFVSGDAGNDTINGGDGHDILHGGTGNDILNGDDGDDVLAGSAGADTLDGGNGNDTVDYGAATAAVSVDLAAGTGSGGDGTDTLLNIENAVLSGFNDTAYGSVSANTISGGAGNDIIFGSAGNDDLDGGQGTDILDYSLAAAAVEVDLTAGTVADDGDGGADTVRNFEKVIGSDYADYLRGDSGNNIFSGGGGIDTIYGDEGTDTVSYADAVSGIDVNLEDGIASADGDGDSDLIFNIENVIGSASNDIIIGSYEDNLLQGSYGNDTLSGGAGNDTLDGGSGTDIADYTDAASGIVVSLSSATVTNDGDGGVDTLISVETIIGSSFADSFLGSTGSDTIYGGDGDDYIYGSDGNDYLSGDAGSDIYSFYSNDDDIIEDTNGSADTIQFTGSTGAHHLSFANSGTYDLVITDNLYGNTITVYGHRNVSDTKQIEYVSFADGSIIDLVNYSSWTIGTSGSDTMNGTSSKDIFIGQAGTDTLTGNAGDDDLYGGAGNDTLRGGSGDDILDGGDGIDTATYSTAASGITVSILDGTVSDDGDGGSDTLSRIENIIGSSYGDSIRGGNANNTITAGDGNDTVYGDLGNDTLNGGSGIDTLDFSEATAAVDIGLNTEDASGAFGNDEIIGFENAIGSAYDDRIYGSASTANALYGNDGDDWLRGGSGNDSLYGGSGSDVYSFSTADDDIVDDTSGNADVLEFDISSLDHNELNFATSGTYDLIVTNDVYTGDSITILGQRDPGDTKTIERVRFYDGAEADLTRYAEWVFGASSADTMTGTIGDDIIMSLGGNDTVSGGDGHDWLLGGAGVDTLHGQSGNDEIYGGAGGDIITGGDGNDKLFGNVSADTISGNAGNDYLDGGEDTDTVTYAAAAAGVTASLALGTASNDGDGGSDILVNFENLTGSSYDDNLTGNSAANVISGGEGNNTVDGGAGNDTLSAGSGDDLYIYGYATGNDSITDTGGIDTIHVTGGKTINDITISNEGTDEAKIVIAGSANTLVVNNIRHATSANHIDFITFDDGFVAALPGYQSWIRGTNGSEELMGTSADDILISADGDDEVHAGSGNDDIHGGAGGDVIYGGEGNDQLFGGDGDDSLIGEAGNDILNGGTGIDLAIYDAATSAVSVDLLAGTATGGDGSDILVDVENVSGSSFDDDIAGNDDDNYLAGNAGDDLLSGGQGNDVIVGGTGVDTVSYETASASVVVDLLMGTAEGGAGSDTIFDVENIRGSSYADTLLGSDDSNYLEGNDGDDILKGYAESDSLYGGAGNDTLDGGSGIDTVSYNSAQSGVSVSLFDGVTSNDGDGGTDTLLNIENVIGSGFADTVLGDHGKNIIFGGDGNDVLSGLGGGDIIDGGMGDDEYRFALSDGHDLIEDGGGLNDSIMIADSVNSDLLLSDFLIQQDGNDLFIGVDSANSITVIDHYDTSNNYQIEKLYFNNDYSSYLDLITMTWYDGNINSAPIAQDDIFAGDEDNNIIGNLFSDNGNGIDYDPDDDAISAISGTFATTSGGAVTIEENGDFVYVPQANYSGTDSFEYTIIDAGDLTAQAVVYINVNPVNDAPLISSNGGGASASVQVTENTQFVTSVVAADQEGDNLSYSIVGGADAASFAIDEQTGELTFNVGPDFESASDNNLDNIYDVNVQVSDGYLVDSQNISVTVIDTNETPIITSGGADATASVSISENSALVTTITASDPDASSSVLFTIIGGEDSTKFIIDTSTGVLSFANEQNFEAPTDFDADNIYKVKVQASDGVLSDTQDISVTVTNINETPEITSGEGGSLVALNISENTKTVYTVTASDPDSSSSLAYSIVGGADSAHFAINSSTGVLEFVNPPNYEGPTDDGTNNIYNVQVSVSDGALSDVQDVAVTVIGINESPVITSSGGAETISVNVASGNTEVLNIEASDPDAGQALSYSISGGEDSGKFSIDSTTGELSFIATPDFANPDDFDLDNTYKVNVQVSDGTLTDTQGISVVVTSGNQAPVAVDDAFSTLLGAELTGNVLDNNGSGVDSDPDSDPLEVIEMTTTSAQGITVSINSDGSFTYQTGVDYVGVDTFTYTLSDGNGETDTATVSVTVSAPSGATVGTSSADSITGTSNADTIFALGGNDHINAGQGHDSVYGGGGNDTVNGQDGNDAIYDGAGDDLYTGGNGTDAVIVNLNSAGFVIYRDNSNYIMLRDTNTTGLTGPYGTNRVYNDIENIQFNDVTLNLTTMTFANNGVGWGTAATYNGTSSADVVTFLPSRDIAYSGAGDDSLYGGFGDDDLHGEDGNDYINGDSGNDSLYGGAGNDTVNGGEGNDLIYDGGGDDLYSGGAGTDTVVVNLNSAGFVIYRDNSNYIMLRDTNTTGLIGPYGTNRVYNDIENIQFNDVMLNLTTMTFTNNGVGWGTAETYNGTSSADVVTFLPSRDIAYGGGGDDSFYGGFGDDDLYGEDGNDFINGDSGNDNLYGGAGNDTVNGGVGDDTLFFDAGNDNFGDIGGVDRLHIIGASVNDIIFSNSSSYNTRITLPDGAYVTVSQLRSTDFTKHIEFISFDDGFVTSLPDYAAWLKGTSGNDTVAGNGSDNTMIGLAGNDTMTGGSGNDDMHGGAGNDTLDGDDGTDLLYGGDGDDILYGEGGLDTLHGGAGADTFKFFTASAFSNVDVIRDFSAANDDVLDLTDILDNAYDPLTDDIANFISFSESSGSTFVSVDRDGTGGTYSMAQIVKLENVVGLSDPDTLITNGNLAVNI